MAIVKPKTKVKQKKTPVKKPKAPVKKPKAPARQIKKHKPEKPKESVSHNPNESFCSFCGRSNFQLMALIAGPNNIFICHNCVEVCNAILLEEFRDVWQARIVDLYNNPGSFRRPFI